MLMLHLLHSFSEKPKKKDKNTKMWKLLYIKKENCYLVYALEFLLNTLSRKNVQI